MKGGNKIPSKFNKLEISGLARLPYKQHNNSMQTYEGKVYTFHLLQFTPFS